MSSSQRAAAASDRLEKGKQKVEQAKANHEKAAKDAKIDPKTGKYVG